MRQLLVLFGSVAACWLGLCLFLFLTQRSLIYFPVREVERPDLETLRLPVDGAELKLWVVERPGPRALIYFGGNGEDVSWNAAGLAAAVPDHTLVLVNYRGYGGSSGRPTERALTADALAVYDHVRARKPEVALVGRSLGAAVALRLAAGREVERLVLVTPFDSLARVGQAHYRFLPVRLLLRDRYDAARHAPRVAAPVLMIVAGRDEIVPAARSAALAQLFEPGQLQAVTIEDAMHNTLDGSPEYLAALARFLRPCAAPRPIC